MKKIFILLITIYLVFINTYNSSLDETDWISAGQSFKNALLALSPKDTYVGYISLHPGVTVLWISSIIQLIFPHIPYPSLILIHRLTFLTIGSILALASVNLLLKFFNQTILLVMFCYLLLEPHSVTSVGLSWLDFLLTFFIFLCLLIWVKSLSLKNKTDIIITGILLGLAILTKFMGLYLYIMLPIMLPVVTFFYSKANRIAFKDFVKPLIAVFCLSFATFIILYPAMWTNPGRTLFSRFNKHEAGHEITITRSESILKTFPYKIPDMDPIFFIGIPLLIFDLRSKKELNSFSMLTGLGGFVYILCLTTTLLIIFDKGRGDSAFVSGLGRYLQPAIPLIGLYVFSRLLTGKFVNQTLKISLLITLFLGKFYRIFYP